MPSQRFTLGVAKAGARQRATGLPSLLWLLKGLQLVPNHFIFFINLHVYLILLYKLV